jgi:hypothetical protein
MEEIETPIEKIQEELHEIAHHAQENWIGKVALFSALIAVFAAVAALLAGHHSNEAMISQIKASDSWSYYQAKGIKALILQNKIQMLLEFGKTVSTQDEEKSNDYKKEQDQISEKAKDLEKDSENHLKIHEIMARTVTLLQVAIAISAITVLTRRKKFLFVSFAFTLLAIGFFIQALLN